MRRLLAILALIALIVAACGGENGSTETAQDTSPAPGSWPTCFTPAAFYSADKACANLDPDASEATGHEALAFDHAGGQLLEVRPDRTPLDHACLVHPNQVFVTPQEDFDPVQYGMEPVEPAQLFFSEPESEDELGEELEDAQAVIAQYEELGVGLFQITDGGDLLTRIDQILGDGFDASPHYVIAPAPTWKYGPHTAVRALTGWNWSQLPITREDGAAAPVEDGARVVVIDTGATGNPVSDIGLGVAEPEGDVDPFVKGHGVFAASIVKQFNPALTVDLYRAGFEDGTLTEASVTAALLRAAPAGKAVVNFSLGTYECAVEYGSVGLTAILSNLPDTVRIVAASGNDAEKLPNHPTMFPARLGMDGSMPGKVVAVGALDITGNRAVWSNEAQVDAPGENLIGWYHDGTTGGLAVWSGTSFAAPHFAACIASELCEMP
ncbi:MAG TPA: S8/S53 family peptidase [Acidimicrobiia bacterium]|nr:S8/S53 family peptidase [Acidimicrobiia bacterium]